MAAIVIAVVLFIIFKFKDRGQDIPEQTHGNPMLEIGMTILPAIILITVAIPTVAKIFNLAKSDDAACVVNVTGQQWWWEYDYPVAADGSICGFAPSTAAAAPPASRSATAS